MTLGSTLTRVAQFAPAVALAFGVASADAQSLSTGQCFKGPEISAKLSPLLDKDGQKNIAQAAEIDGADTARRFYSNADGTLAYDLKGNLPNGQKQSEYCVKAVITNLTLLPHSDANKTVPSWLGAKSGDGVSNGSNLEKSYASGSKFVLVGQVLAEQGGKLYPSNKFGITASKTGDAALQVVKNGYANADYVMKGFALTQFGEAMFARQSAGQNMAQAPGQAPGSLLAANNVTRQP